MGGKNWRERKRRRVCERERDGEYVREKGGERLRERGRVCGIESE